MSYVVHIKPGHHTLYVNKGETVLDAALRQEFIFPYSCQSAVCGTCGGRVLHGEVEYYDPEAVELTEDEKNEGVALFCSAIPKTDLVIYVEGVIAPAELPSMTLPYTVSHQETLSESMKQLILSPATEDHIHYRAGQYIYLMNHQGERQPYSIANAPLGGKQIELHLRQVPSNPFMEQLLKDLASEEPLLVEGPQGNVLFSPAPERPILMLAAGSGFAQMKSLFEQSLNLKYEEPIHLFWVVREEKDFYTNLPKQWEKQFPHFKFTPVLSQVDTSWEGASGRIYEVVTETYPDLSSFQVYASGPSEMVMQTLQHLQQRGLSKEWMHADALSFVGL